MDNSMPPHHPDDLARIAELERALEASQEEAETMKRHGLGWQKRALEAEAHVSNLERIILEMRRRFGGDEPDAWPRLTRRR